MSLITPERREAILKERIQLRLDGLCGQLRQLGEKGLPIAGHKADPPTRLRNYYRDTLPEEMSMILDPEYLVKAERGEYPEPVPVVYYGLLNGQRQAGPYRDPNIAAQEVQAMGFPPNPDGSAPIEPQHNFWNLLLSLPSKSEVFIPFQYHANDFRRLIDEMGKKIEERYAGPL